MQASDAGHHAAQHHLALAYESGAGVEAHPGLALDLLKRSANSDYAPALAKLAQCYLSGALGVAVDAGGWGHSIRPRQLWEPGEWRGNGGFPLLA